MELIFLFLLIALGAGLSKLRVIQYQHVSWATKWIIYVALPAVAIAKLPKLEMSLEMLAPFLSAVFIFLCSAILFLVVFKKYFTRDQSIVLTIVAGLGNTSFIGFPLINFYFGEDSLPIAVIFDQGSFFLFATAAQYLIATRNGSFKPINSVKKIISFPPFIGLIVALFIPSEWIFGWHEYALIILGKSISPVAMLIVGFQISRFVNFQFPRPLYYALTYKLVLAPLVIWAFMLAINASESVFKISVFEASMAPMITPAILLIEHRIERQLTAQILCWGILISFVTSGIVYLLL
jgi:predicted permease